nr:4'-phosphopantetheinyl transferase superfamily protein [Streptomyces sp. SID5785]
MPAGVAVAEARHDPPGVWLHPAEAALVEGVVERRRREFTTVRHCARQALHRLGLPPAPVLPDPFGAPRWPAGVVGSLTHCDGYRAAALAPAAELAMLGIDAEPHAPLPDGVLDAIALPAERARLRAAPPGTHWDRLLFSAKEAVYKAWYPYTGHRLTFTDADLHLTPDGTFTAHLRPLPATSPLPHRLQGRWAIRKGLTLTSAYARHAG